ncbi:protein croquemort [Scaptodrosophila lebanonensis]|uniref:Protein croquemort n=1 Tax=Drosophila lebanonensis TaxID=7225 RepID=A0A6J2U802_DROLE|nr:protein croquemort [Scaptodrosophila lebanonensis]
MLPLAPESFIYKRWVTTPTPVYTTFYLFNWTNPQDINNEEVKPNFEQLGPYTFSDFKVKEGLMWHQQRPEVTYYGRRTWHFLPERSKGQLDDIVVTPHFPTVTAAGYARKYRKILRKIMNYALNREGGAYLFRHTAAEWMFDGFYDSLIDFAERLHSPLVPIYSDHFAWLYQRNNSKNAEGNFTIHTGRGDLRQMGDLKMWNGTTHTGLYAGECGKVNGSTGELWAPDRQWHETLSIFIPDVARFINMYSRKNVSVEGIDAWRYETTELSFDNGQLAPDTECFCVPNRECPKNGVVDFSPVSYHGPFYLSHPHFYMTDEMYRENITGLQPDAEKHGMYLIMEPTLGIPLRLNGQMMISVRVQRDEAIDYLKDVAYDHYAPLLVLQMQAELNDELISLIKLTLSIPHIGQYVGIAFLIIGLTMLTVGVVLNKKHKWHNEVPPKTVDKTNKPNAD